MDSPQRQRKEIIALNGDVVDYSKLMADDLDLITKTLKDYRKLIDAEIGKGQGALVDFIGDNFMAVFDDARNAVQTAIAITSAIESRNRDIPEPRQVKFRMGMDMGDVAVEEGRYFGDALNIAARIQAIALSGGLCISGRVYRELDEPALRFRPAGSRRLKNIPEEVEVYEFADLPTSARPLAERRMLALESPTVAVLPIHSEVADDYVRGTAKILRADMLHRLASVPQLKVVDAHAEGGREEVIEVARYMLETGVHQHRDNIRVFATLFDVTTMNIVKSYKWFVKTDELIDLSENFANDIASSIEVELIVGEPAGLYAELDDPQAIEKVYLGWYHLRSDTQNGWVKAIELFEQVCQAHPGQPYGFVLASFGYWIGAANGWVRDMNETLLLAEEKARIGSENGDPTGMAQAVQGAILMSRGLHEEALEAVEQLEILRPTCDVTYGLEGSVRRYLGQWEKAVNLLDVAMRLTGINKPWYPTVKACSLFIGNKIDQAMSMSEMVLDYQPNNLEALLVLGATQVELGMNRRAKQTIDRIRLQFPAVDVEEWFDNSPYRSRELIERWKSDLAMAG